MSGLPIVACVGLLGGLVVGCVSESELAPGGSQDVDGASGRPIGMDIDGSTGDAGPEEGGGETPIASDEAADGAEVSGEPDSSDSTDVPDRADGGPDAPDFGDSDSTCEGLEAACSELGATRCAEREPAIELCAEIDPSGCLVWQLQEVCDDGDACTDDACADGVCAASPISCDDGNACTDDTCNPSSGCEAKPVVCGDGDLCTLDGCDPAVGCTHAPDLCDDGNACTQDSCKPVSGCSHVALPCDDGDLCNGGETCDPATGCLTGSPLDCDDGNACNGTETCEPKSGCVPGTPLACNDGDACTVDLCKPDVGCTNESVDCDDGAPCNGHETCDSAKGCVQGAPVDCDDGSPCTTDTCDPVTGDCSHVPDDSAEACDDGDACTEGDACAAGACLPGVPISCDDGSPCTTDACDLVTGDCFHDPDDSAESCDDGDACTEGDSCSAGACLPGVPVSCDDASPCTTDACDPGTGDCFHDADDTAESCDDGDACTEGVSCSAGACIPGVPVSCDDASPCTTDTCDPVTGDCSHVPDDTAESCDDGDACTEGDSCSAGACLPGVPISCDDGSPCTTDACDPGTGDCSHDPDASAEACDDGDACTGGDACDGGVCLPGVPVSCDDGSPCTDDDCDPGTGDCVHGPDASAEACDDGDVCTEGDACAAGVCLPGVPISCDDASPCTTDACDPGTGDCFHDADDSAESCDDGDACTEGDSCSAGACLPGVPISCDDGSPCTDDACDPGTGDCFHDADDSAESCDDGDACTEGDACSAGVCLPGAVSECDDENPCTDDACDSGSGCVATPNADPCDDGDACTEGDACSEGACVPGAAILCDHEESCTDDACAPASGCVTTANADLCDDADACTTADICTDGFCKGGPPPDCDDGNLCTDDACDPASGCMTTANDDSCDDADACTTADSCSGGECLAGIELLCDDGEPCTDDACEPSTGCTAMPNAAPCDDGDPCTLESACAGGECTSGSPDFDVTFGGPGYDKAYAVASLPGGGFALAGFTDFEGGGGDDMWLVRTDASGELLWDRTFGGGSNDNAYALSSLPDGGFALAGYTSSKGAGVDDMWLVRTDASGELLWDRTFGGGGYDEARALVALPDSGFALAGDTSSSSAGGADMWLVRTDGSGELLWDRAFGGGSHDQAHALAFLLDGGFALAGYTTSKGAGSSDMWFVRTDASGELLWDRTFGGDGEDVASALAVLPDGGYALAGRTNSKGDGSYDMWLVRTDDMGELLWDRTFAGGGFDVALALLSLPDGAFALAGQTQHHPTGAGSHDMWLVRTNAGGELLWDRTFGGGDTDVAEAAASLSDGGFVLAGWTGSKSGGVENMWLVVTTNGAPCDDGEPCGGFYECLEGTCSVPVPGDCDDGDPCTDDSCDSSTGCTFSFNADPCDDGDPCTLESACTGGECLGGLAAFDMTFGGGGGDYAYALASLPDGGFALSGGTYSKGVGGEDIWLVRTNDAGELLWDQTFGGGSGDEAYALASLADGQFALAGYTSSKGAGGQDMWLVRTDATGELLWDRTFGGGTTDIARALAPLSDGGFAMAGYTASQGAGSYDMWLVRTGAVGELLWDRTFGGGDDDRAYAISSLLDGGFALAGFTSSKGAGSADMWLVRTDPTGEILWDRTFGGGSWDEAQALAPLTGGGFALAGYTFSEGAGGSDMWLVRTSASGELLWDRTFGGGSADSAHALASIPEGGFAVAGHTFSKGAGSADMWLVRTDAEGDLLWERTFGGGSSEEAYALASLPNGGFALAGNTESIGAGGPDMWLVVTTDGAPCDDDEPCDGLLECFEGTCSVPAPLDCDDGDPETADSCSPGVGCVHDPMVP